MKLPFEGWRWPGISDAGHVVTGKDADMTKMVTLHRWQFTTTFNQLATLDLPREFSGPLICVTAAGDAVVKAGYDSSPIVMAGPSHTSQENIEGWLRAVLPGDRRVYARKKNDDYRDCEVLIVDGQEETLLLAPPGQKWSALLSICSIEEKMAIVDMDNKRLDIYHNNQCK